jgi:hypothetical protein
VPCLRAPQQRRLAEKSSRQTLELFLKSGTKIGKLLADYCAPEFCVIVFHSEVIGGNEWGSNWNQESMR